MVILFKITNINFIFLMIIINHKGKIKYRCIECKNNTLEEKEKCLAYFTLDNKEFTNGYNANHTPHKYYTSVLERNNTMIYI